jgi:hypothetical protein
MTMTETSLAFPSVPWFQALAAAAARDGERYRHLGVVDMALAVWVGDECYRLVFEDYGCSEVTEWDGPSPVDCALGAAPEDWEELVRHIQANRHADPHHTLNSLVLVGDRFSLTGDDQLGIDTFYRFNATIQAFFEECAAVPTHFE